MPKLAAVPVTKSLYMAGVPVYSMTMTVDEFVAIPRCPFQRDEKLRLSKAHLRVLMPQHALVAIAVLPDGTLCKVDAHTRAAKWEDGSLERPRQLVVSVFSVKTIEEVEAIYDSFDASEASKTGMDKVQSGLSKHDLALKTPWLAAGRFSASLALACTVLGKGRLDKKAQVDLFSDELALFDSIEPSQSNFIIGIGAGALLILKKYGASGLDFLRRYNSNLGNKIGDEKDAVQMLTDFLKQERMDRRYAGAENNKRHAQMILALHARHATGKMHKRLPRPVDLASYLP